MPGFRGRIRKRTGYACAIVDREVSAAIAPGGFEERALAREYSPEYWPHEVGLEPLLKVDKPDFIGRDAYLPLAERPPREKLVMLEIDAETADAVGGEPVFTLSGRPAGRVTSGAYDHWVDKSLALAMVRSEVLAEEVTFDVAVLGRPHRARLLAEPPFDTSGARLRS